MKDSPHQLLNSTVIGSWGYRILNKSWIGLDSHYSTNNVPPSSFHKRQLQKQLLLTGMVLDSTNHSSKFWFSRNTIQAVYAQLRCMICETLPAVPVLHQLHGCGTDSRSHILLQLQGDEEEGMLPVAAAGAIEKHIHQEEKKAIGCRAAEKPTLWTWGTGAAGSWILKQAGTERKTLWHYKSQKLGSAKGKAACRQWGSPGCCSRRYTWRARERAAEADAVVAWSLNSYSRGPQTMALQLSRNYNSHHA